MKFNRTALLLLLICSLPVSGMTAETAAPVDAKVTVQGEAAKPEGKPVTSSAPAAQKLRLGYVDVTRIGSDSDLGKQSKLEAKQKQEKFQGQIENRKKQLEKQKKAIETKIASLTPAQREAKAREFQKKVEEFQKFGMNAEKELFTFQEQLSNSMVEAMEQAAVEYGKSQGLALVVVKREMLYLSGDVDAVDVTDGVIKAMNEKGTKK